MRTLFIASDHAGFELKEELKKQASSMGIEFQDLGTHSLDSVHYPEIAQNFCKELLKSEMDLNEPCGVLICGSGIGVSIGANRYPEIRAALVHNEELAQLSRQHNRSNVLCLGARFVSTENATKILKEWISAEFEGGRHQTRVDLLGQGPEGAKGVSS